MRVGIIGLQHEANTFNPAPANLQAFHRHTGQEIVEYYSQSHHEIGGFLEGLAEAKLESVPLFSAGAIPSGRSPREALATMIQVIEKMLAGAGKLDGLLLAPHGAGVSQDYPDMDGYWLSHVRKIVGPDMPIIATIDPHCNLSQLMVDSVDAIISYKTNPHIDQRQTGVAAARLMARTLAGEVKPVMAASLPAIAIDIERQHTPSEPCVSFYKLASEIASREGVLSDSIVLGFPYADVAEMGSSLIVVTDNDKAKAEKYADELTAYLIKNRQDFTGRYIDIPQAIEKARLSTKPVCMFDMGDNVGGGAPGDYTLLAHALFDAGDLKTFVTLVDEKAQSLARSAGVGATVELPIGGQADAQFGKPITAQFKVISLHDGKFTEDKPRHGGMTKFDAGATAIVACKNLTVQITSKRLFPASLNGVLAFGLVPEQFDVMIAKGVHAPAAAFEPVCPTRIRVNTPGITGADMRKFTYHNRRRPLFPLEDVLG